MARPGIPTLVAAKLTATLLLVGAAPLGSAPAEPPQEGLAPVSPTVVQRTYRGPGLRDFKAGHRAWELHDWKTALDLMSQAAKVDPDHPEAQVRLPGVFVSPYIPRFYESHAQCQLGACDDVRREMDKILMLLKDAGYLRNRYQKDCLKACPRLP
jgi:hypothetical protein